MLQRGQLWRLVASVTKRALKSGALESIPTDYEFIEDRGALFFVRIVTNLERKEKLKRVESGEGSGRQNPFLPYEEELFVTRLSDTHLCLLNKYNVVDHHLLIVTSAFEHQDAPLTLADFTALWTGLLEYDSLGFYNGGRIAGASQEHKHLQLVPLPLAPQGPKVPLSPLFEGKTPPYRIAVCPRIPFPHSFARLKEDVTSSPSSAAERTLALYHKMQEALDVGQKPFNLLVTREWIFLVPRTRECFCGISVNAIGFAGGLLVRDDEQMERIRKAGPMEALIHTSG